VGHGVGVGRGRVRGVHQLVRSMRIVCISSCWVSAACATSARSSCRRSSRDRPPARAAARDLRGRGACRRDLTTGIVAPSVLAGAPRRIAEQERWRRASPGGRVIDGAAAGVRVRHTTPVAPNSFRRARPDTVLFAP
jgi:hypothetical protein